MTLLIIGAAVVLWLAVAALTTPLRLRARMSAPVCARCGNRKNRDGSPRYCTTRYPRDVPLRYDEEPVHQYRQAPRGALRDRTRADVNIAFLAALTWPATVPAVLLAAAVTRGPVVAAAWSYRKVTEPLLTKHLTGPELERRIRQQEADIARLEQQIGTRP